MFTGIIEEIGTVKNIQRNGSNSFIVIEVKKVLEDVHLGDSIAVNGVCLTVTKTDGSIFQADVMNETLSRSSLGELRQGSKVNLERAMAANGRFGGHIVSGHIDGTGTITDIVNDGIAIWYTISANADIMRYIVEKGSIAIDGISKEYRLVGDFRFAKYANFLLKNYFPLHDDLCYEEGRAMKDYADRQKWARMSLMNTATSGVFASDNSIRNYAENIWHATPINKINH